MSQDSKQFAYNWVVIAPLPNDIEQTFQANGDTASCTCAWWPMSNGVSAIVMRDGRVIRKLSNASTSMYDALFQADAFLQEHDQ